MLCVFRHLIYRPQTELQRNVDRIIAKKIRKEKAESFYTAQNHTLSLFEFLDRIIVDFTALD